MRFCRKALRGNELARTRAAFGAGIPYDDRCALAFGVVVEEAVRNGASHRRNVIDRLIAAMVHGLSLVTRNSEDFKHLTETHTDQPAGVAARVRWDT